jgi:hypothetical protein
VLAHAELQEGEAEDESNRPEDQQQRENGPKYPRKLSRQLFLRMSRDKRTQGIQVWR